MFALNNGGAMCNAFPDVCITPIPSPTGPIPTPLPYPNISTTQMADPATAVLYVLIAGMPALNQQSKILLSNGDQTGTQGGVVSGTFMKETTFLVASIKVMIGGIPAVRLTAQTGHNGSPPNSVGACMAPSQTVVMVMS